MLKFKVQTLVSTAVLSAAFLFSGAGRPLFAQCYNNVSVDENGVGLFVCGSVGQTPIIPLPVSGGGASPLIYNLSFSVTPGDLILTEPGTSGSVNTDVLRFTNDGGSRLTFFSDNLDGADALADFLQGLPTTFQGNTSTQTEVGLEGSNGIVWTPLPGQPGAITSLTFSNVTYTIVSDGSSVPEPATMILVLPAAGLIWLRRRKARA